MKSEITWSTAMPQPAMAIPVCPVATNADSSPRARAAASSSSVTDILPIAQSEPTVCTTRTSGRSAGRRHAQARRRGAQVAQLDAARPRPRPTARGPRTSTVCSPASTSHPGADRLQQRGAPLGGQRAAERRDADHEHVRAQRRGLGDAGHDRHGAARVGHDVGSATAPAAAASTTRDDLARRRSAGCRARSWRGTSREQAAGEEREPVSHRPAPRRGPGARTARAGRPRARAR